jgi:hypothetical protein
MRSTHWTSQRWQSPEKVERRYFDPARAGMADDIDAAVVGVVGGACDVDRSTSYQLWRCGESYGLSVVSAAAVAIHRESAQL